MKADRNSLHAKLYEFTYTSDLPSNLCPYFWKLVWATIIFIPNFIIQLPALIINLFRRESYDCSDFRALGIITYILLAVVYGYGMATFHWTKAMFNCYSYSSELANWGIGLNAGFIVITLGVLLVNHLVKPQKNKKEKKPSIIKEFVKAKYNRYCPKIDWE